MGFVAHCERSGRLCFVVVFCLLVIGLLDADVGGVLSRS